jgi:CRP-like cAMP-binding protein
MSSDRVVAPLLRVPLFQELSGLQVAAIAREAEKVKFRRGDLITRAGEPGDGAFLIVSGTVIADAGLWGNPEPVEVGSLIGELAMLTEHDYGSTTRACDRVLCLKLTRAGMHARMLEDPALAAHFQQRIRDRLLKLAEELRHIEGLFLGNQLDPAGPDVSTNAAVATG